MSTDDFSWISDENDGELIYYIDTKERKICYGGNLYNYDLSDKLNNLIMLRRLVDEKN